MTDERLKQLMEQVGMPNSISLYGVLQQAENEGFQAGAASRDAEIQRLQMTLADAEALELGTAEKNDQLRAELVKALAACKTKDEALEKACNRIEEYGFEIGEYWKTGRDALAIQPDDSALKAWLGAPVSYLYKHYSAFGDDVFWSHRPNHQGVAALETKALYSPKELK